jgi:hypothetical protein
VRWERAGGEASALLETRSNSSHSISIRHDYNREAQAKTRSWKKTRQRNARKKEPLSHSKGSVKESATLAAHSLRIRRAFAAHSLRIRCVFAAHSLRIRCVVAAQISPSLFHSFTHSLIHISFTPSLIHSFIHSYVSPSFLFYTLIHIFFVFRIHSLTHSFYFIYSLSPSLFIRSFIHSLIHISFVFHSFHSNLLRYSFSFSKKLYISYILHL